MSLISSDGVGSLGLPDSHYRTVLFQLLFAATEPHSPFSQQDTGVSHAESHVRNNFLGTQSTPNLFSKVPETVPCTHNRNFLYLLYLVTTLRVYLLPALTLADFDNTILVI